MSGRHIFQGSDTIINSVHSHVFVLRIPVLHGSKDARHRREDAGQAFRIAVHLLLQPDVFLLQPFRQLLKGQGRVHDSRIPLCLVLLRHAGADEHGLGLRIPALDVAAVGLHRRKGIRQIFDHLRIVLLNQQVNGRAGRTDDHRFLLLVHQAFVICFYHGRSDCRLFHIGKTQLLQTFPHRIDAHAVVIGNERRGHAGDHRLSALNHHLDLLHFADNFLGVLRTDYKTPAAEDAFVSDDVGLIAGKPDGLHRTVPNAFIAILAIGFLKSKAMCHDCSFPQNNVLINYIM